MTASPSADSGNTTTAAPPPVAGASTPESAARKPPPGWVPIRSLSPEQRPTIAAHLLALDERDRYLRFGYPANDAQIQRYVDGLNFERDELFGIFNRQLELVALAHLAFPGPGFSSQASGALPPPAAEFGVSVVADARGRGWGARLFEHAVLHARNRRHDTLFIHALSENTAMLRIARKAGGVVVRSGSETDAFVRLPPDTVASRLQQWVGEGAARIDYHLKQQTRRTESTPETPPD